MSVKILKQHLIEYGLPTDGLKPALAERLTQAMQIKKKKKKKKIEKEGMHKTKCCLNGNLHCGRRLHLRRRDRRIWQQRPRLWAGPWRWRARKRALPEADQGTGGETSRRCDGKQSSDSSVDRGR
jgi:hypothetical protein